MKIPYGHMSTWSSRVDDDLKNIEEVDRECVMS